jgi:hypothetical protein
MNKTMAYRYTISRIHLLFFVLSIILGAAPALSQDEKAVALLTGGKDLGVGGNVYHLSDLQQGQSLFVRVDGTSGNFDPFIGLGRADLDLPTLRERFIAETEHAKSTGGDTLQAVSRLAEEFLLAWDDDSGPGYAAAFEWRVPVTGDYKLIVTSTPLRKTFGNYRLLVGLDAPQVLSGKAESIGRVNIALDVTASPSRSSVEEITGTLTAERTSTLLELEGVRATDTLYAFVEATSGDLTPILRLEDFSGKQLRSDSTSEQQVNATLEYTFQEAGNYRLRISSCCEEGTRTEGDYRLLLGINAPEVMTGKAAPMGIPLIKRPTEVRVGIKLQQITSVDQRAENFGVVADLRLEWNDPKLAFSPDTCQCDSKIFTVDGFIKHAQEQGIKWPEFNYFNQQGRSWFQSQLVTVYPDGRTTLDERFSATLQAPEFDFRTFPFDTQQFYIHLVSVLPEESFTYADLEGFSALGQKLGEEEWIVEEFETTIDSLDGQSHFAFVFEAHRHLTYYGFRIFLPILIIILVSWITFFIRDYGKRIDVASANLLLFIAFNFTISNDLPRLGYLTLLDTILVSTFAITGLVILINVYLRRLELAGDTTRIQRIDKFIVWAYPFLYLISFAVLKVIFT